MQFEGILFDCDGVLVDSEPITLGALRHMLNASGWAITAEECQHIFIGKTVRSETARIERETGRPLTDAWMAAFYALRDEGLHARLQAVPGAVAAVQQCHALLGGNIAVASGADKAKVLMQLDKVGLLSLFDPHIFSGHDLPRTKPFPDVYLAAAASLRRDPRRCLVIEDALPGLQAGLAAGATVWGYCPREGGHTTPEALLAAGAQRVLRDMGELPGLLGQTG
ncbi:MAG: HAD family phosphatase [Comamonas sp.]|nr:HAD family phosphatase [Comamonas sp.]